MKLVLALLAVLLLSRTQAAAHPPLALAVFAPDSQEQAFGARHVASQMGIPYFFTHDVGEALRQPMVIVTGAIGGAFMTTDVTNRMRGYLESGGILVADDGESEGIQDLSGIASLSTGATRYTMTFDTSSGDAGFSRLRQSEERTIRLGNRTLGKTVITQAYKLKAGTDARVLARFDDGNPAIVGRVVGRGRIYVTGLGYFDAVLRPQDDQANEAGRVYDNGFEPSADVPQLIVRDWYLHFVPGAVVTDPSPGGLAGAMIITHDVDFSRSIVNMLAYAQSEQAHHFSATYFIQTKTVRDLEDTAFFDARAKQIVNTILSEGANIASHTVAHAPDYRSFARGTGAESPSNYHPVVTSISPDHRGGHTDGASLIGEIHVSKERLDACNPSISVDALRTGYLLVQKDQFTVEERYGYRYDSSYAGGEVMTAFPYTAMEKQGDAAESRILEFPIAIADGEDPGAMLSHVSQLDGVLDDISAIHGVVVVLIHPNVVADKLKTEFALVDHARPAMWVGNVDAFGDFWNKRSEITVTATPAADGETVTVFAPHGVDGLTLDFPGPVAVVSAAGTRAASAGGGTAVVLDRVAAGHAASITVTSTVKH